MWGKVGLTGTAGRYGFVANFKMLGDGSGNVSWNLLTPEKLIERGDLNGGIAYDADPEACAYPVFNWFREYAKTKNICAGS
ncbi:hypothetical protein [Aquiflexum sp.]|uniref:hypothetical protein n=1 Tax=Aquiflexum sp. TaxID=1872584 RepID=UPI003593913B